MHRNHLIKISTLVGLLALAWVKLDPDAATAPLTTGASETGCDLSQLQSHCATHPQFAHAIGDGFLVVLPGDFF
jgi:hypothetical protein